MLRFRWVRVALLIFYIGILVGVQFHTHASGTDQLTAHCKSCHVSQTFYYAEQSGDLHITFPVLHSCEPAIDSPLIQELNKVSPGRAPPLS